MAPPIPPEASKEIERVRALVGRHFPVYDIRVSYDVVEFFVRVDMTTLEENFEQMRAEMKDEGYIPMIIYDKGEHIVTVARKPQMRYRSLYVNLTLLIITAFTMMFAGAMNWLGYAGEEAGSLFSPEVIAMGALTFTLPLMAILSIHELGHYFAARRRKIAASMPFFIPSIPPLGTFGAFISLRDPIPNKKTLLEVGVAGPMAGLIVAIPLGVLGLLLTNSEARPVPLNVGSEGVLGISFPLIYIWLERLTPIQGDYLLHPTAFAAWVGFLVTALNLLPVGQLDGGHVARALMGARAKYLSWATVAVLVGIGMLYFGWLLFALLILFLGARHPPPLNDLSPLDTKRKWIGIFAFVVLVIAFVPVPLQSIPADYSFELTPQGGTNVTIEQGGATVLSLVVSNKGNSLNDIMIHAESSPQGWNVGFKRSGLPADVFSEAVSVLLNASESSSIDVRILASPVAELDARYAITIAGFSLNSSLKRNLSYDVHVTESVFSYVVSGFVDVTPNSWALCVVEVHNDGPEEEVLTVAPGAVRPASLDVYATSDGLNSTESIDVVVPAYGTSTFTIAVFVNEFAVPGEKEITIELYFEKSLQMVMTLVLRVV